MAQNGDTRQIMIVGEGSEEEEDGNSVTLQQ